MLPLDSSAFGLAMTEENLTRQMPPQEIHHQRRDRGAAAAEMGAAFDDVQLGIGARGLGERLALAEGHDAVAARMDEQQRPRRDLRDDALGA